MAKRRKGRTFRKKMGGNPENPKEKQEKPENPENPKNPKEEQERKNSPVDISGATYKKYKTKITKPLFGTETTYGETYSGPNISKLSKYYRENIIPPKPTSSIEPTDEPTDENISGNIVFKDDVSGGKLRRTRKRRMSKRRRNSRKSRKSKSRKMHRGGLGLGSVLDFFRKKKQENQGVVNMRGESNSGFGSQQRVSPQPIKEENQRVVNMTTESNSGFENQPVQKEKINRIE